MKKLDVETLKKHKKKLIVAGIGVAVLTLAGFGGNYYVQAKETEKQEIQQKEEKKKEVAKQEVEKKKQAELKVKLEKEEADKKAEEERVKAEEQKKADEEKAKAEEQAKQEAERVKQEEEKKVEEQKKSEEGKQEEQENGNQEGKKQGNGQENKQVKTQGNEQTQAIKGVAKKVEEPQQGSQENPNKSQVKQGGEQEKQPSNNQEQSKQVAQQPASNDGNQQANVQQEQGTAMTRAVSNSNVGQRTDQIVAVVAQGSSAKVTYLEKHNGNWQEVFTTNGFVGSQGVGQANESVSRTPRGAHSLGFAFGTSNPGTNLPFRQITPNSYWISNVNDDQYNTWQERDNSSSQDEHLIKETVAYKYGIVINYNTSNPVKGGGSGFFLHVSNGRSTAGCVSVPQAKMVELMQKLHGGAYIVNVNSINEISNY
ncbi:cell surface protein [Bacillus toyonensis]|nr:cell surface protein [Bacillus toyonensis]